MTLSYHTEPDSVTRDALVALGLPSAKVDRLMDSYRPARTLANATPAELSHAADLTERQSARVAAAFALGRAAFSDPYRPMLRRPEEVASYLRSLIGTETVECFVVVLLDARQRVIESVTVARGSVSRVEVHPREVFAVAMRCGAHSVIVGHNHPSGDPDPSGADVELTQRLVEVGTLVGIPVLDHVVVSRSGHTSLAERGVVVH